MPKKLLDGKELAGYIQERQFKQVRALTQTHGIVPKLAIIQTKEDPVIDTYVRLKKRYGTDIGVEVEDYFISQSDVAQKLTELNDDSSIHGIIIQLPLENPAETDKLVELVAPEKDVDGLGSDEFFQPATPMAIMWLLAGYNIDLPGKKILLIGRGKLVGAPLERQLTASELDVEVVDRNTEILDASSISADIIITATGSPAILFPDMIKQGAVVVDAGVASEDGKTVGDVASAVYEREDLVITPPKGGVGPLTVCALFDNVIRSAQRAVEATKDA